MVQDVFQYCFKQGKTRQYLHPHQKPIKKRRTQASSVPISFNAILFSEFLDSCTHLLAFFVLACLIIQFLQDLEYLQIVWLD